MKIKYLLIIGIALFFESCGKFLTSEDKDSMIPQLVEDYEAVLHREAFIQKIDNIYTEFITDNVSERKQAYTSTKNAYKSVYTWNMDIEIDGAGMSSSSVNDTWTQAYRIILISNYMLENIDKAIGSENEKKYVRGESYFLRAKNNFELVNLYSKHYNSASATSDLGIPIRLKTGVQERYPRATVEQVYALIESDLLAAINEFAQYNGPKKSLWHPDLLTAKLLLSRVYLYQSRWDECIAVASEVIEATGGELMDLKSNTQSFFVSVSNPEILHAYCSNASVVLGNSIPNIYGSGGNVTYGVSANLLGSFLPGDVRPSKWFASSNGMRYTNKWSSSYTNVGVLNYRVSEAYLNRAEAYSEKGGADESLALDDVKKLVECRVENIAAVTIPTSGDELKKFIFEERRREFCFEGQRIFDIKRKTKFAPINISHEFTAVSGSGTVSESVLYILPKNSPNLIWPIPKDEMSNNDSMIQNPRVVIKPI